MIISPLQKQMVIYQQLRPSCRSSLFIKIFPPSLIFPLILLLIFPVPAISGQGSDFPSHQEIVSPSILLADGLVGWPYQFDQNQISRLNSAGCMFNDEDLAVANRMMNRRFSAEDFVAAYEQAAKMGLRGDDIEKIATFQLLLLPMEEYGKMKSKEMNVTDYYNSRIGGEGMKSSGYVISGLSLIFLSLGMYFIVDATSGDYDCDPDNDMCGLSGLGKDAGEFFGIVFVMGGGIGLMTGVTLIAIGDNKSNHWAKDLDRTAKDEMDKYRLSPQSNDDTIKKQNNNDPEYTKLTIGLSPLVAGGSDKPNGLAFTLMF